MNASIEKMVPVQVDHKDLLELQKKQLRHDQKYHPDILVLRVHERVVHYVLHFAKYSGLMLDSLDRRDQEKLRKTAIDSAIISLAFCNMFNVHAHMPLANQEKNSGLQRAILDFATSTGRMAKAAESLDHLEALNFREDLEKELENIWEILGRVSQALQIDFESAICDRLNSVEQNSIFYSQENTREK